MKVLTKMVEQFKTAHQGNLPEKIVVEPLALTSLTLKRSIAPKWAGCPIECRDDVKAAETRKPGEGTALGVFVDARRGQLVAVDLVPSRCLPSRSQAQDPDPDRGT